ncbi:aldo/keto reductase [Novosphingobium mangrovi (ex Huang et al. 2023)]|uniref:Aldo/keto reductase n=1 Tax=Novosphingobium mangrovi (ex Huang et al. 2023) TaxID=2976432 RepID=A0ABT2I770_9SPHN|nr:aldo/keto reductase [Novosphingobium mangrovi (ex Huang et al. 2023)]MCT2400438.1 aldo/keto reductase [Novosphingobium mangrovi (ex Huang et al. 2023)]
MTSTSSTTPLATRKLGRTGMEITRVGFGAWAIGGPDWAVGWGAQDDADSIRAIRHAVERGVNWIDTAAIYGLGHSERVVAAALAEIPASGRPYVFTKCGQVWDPADRNSKFRVGRADSIRRECEDSLKRLGVDVIDLLQMHWPAEDGSAIDEYWRALLDLKAEGKVRAVGLSNHNADQLDAAEKLGHVDTLQPPLSAIRRGAIERELPWCLTHDTGVIVYSPMQSGLLSGGFSAGRVAGLPSDDWRATHPDFTGDALTRNLQVAEAMKPIAARHGVSQAAVAVAWALAVPGVTGAIVGARSPAQVDGWIAAAGLELLDEDLALVAEAIRTSGAGSGPVSG